MKRNLLILVAALLAFVVLVMAQSTIAQQPFGAPGQVPPVTFTSSGGFLNAAGVAAGPIVLLNGSAATPSLAFANSLGTGLYSRAGSVIDFTSSTHSSTVPNMEIGNNYLELVQGSALSSGLFFSSSTTDASAGVGAGINSSATGVIAMTSGGTQQGVRLQFLLPTLGACGGGTPALVAGAADIRGRATVGTGAPASCVVNFATTWPVAPECWGSVVSTTATDARAIATSTSTTALTLTPATAFVDSSVVAFGCSGRP